MNQKHDFFSILIATINGSGSQTANNILAKSLFRMGVPVGAQNLFPSNIQGLPTWFNICASARSFTARKARHDVIVGLNPSTTAEDIKALAAHGLVLIDEESPFAKTTLPADIRFYRVPFKKLVQPLSDSLRGRKILLNMVYVGIIAELFQIEKEALASVIRDHIGAQNPLLAANQQAVEVGLNWARENVTKPSEAPTAKELKAVIQGPNPNVNKVFIDGNSAAALGLWQGGCSFASWYPITPSSSLIEKFQEFTEPHRAQCAIVQAEDELSAVSMVIGAGWAGARAVTATSGPGLSLMAEAAGLAYFAEVPAVIWDVQRAGPSTGLPTRTMQGDVTFAARLSHGDTKHILLFPAHPGECYEFAQAALDLSEQFQSLVIVLSDLDVGMNFHASPKFSYPLQPLKRGKVLRENDLAGMTQFDRYADVDGDGICYRTLPGTANRLAGYFSRGTGHDSRAGYSENPEVYSRLLERLQKKFLYAKSSVPQAQADVTGKQNLGLIAYGSTDTVIPELRASLRDVGINTNYLRIRAYPFDDGVEEFLQMHEQVIVVEQNRDGQMRELLAAEFSFAAPKMKSLLTYDGLPVCAENLLRSFLATQEAR